MSMQEKRRVEPNWDIKRGMGSKPRPLVVVEESIPSRCGGCVSSVR